MPDHKNDLTETKDNASIQKTCENCHIRKWEYKEKGDYHRNLDPNWSYTPTYLSKMRHVDRIIKSFPNDHRILDAGCGEGVLVKKYKEQGRNISGIDLNYQSELVLMGDILSMPFDDNSFEVVLLLDVFEHLQFLQQPFALKEIKRVLASNGTLVISIPNLAHFSSRVKMFFFGNFIRSDIEANHPGERPYPENIELLKTNGYRIDHAVGITLTVPFLYTRLIKKRPSMFLWLHDFLDNYAKLSLSLLNLFECRNIK